MKLQQRLQSAIDLGRLGSFLGGCALLALLLTILLLFMSGTGGPAWTWGWSKILAIITGLAAFASWLAFRIDSR